MHPIACSATLPLALKRPRARWSLTLLRVRHSWRALLLFQDAGLWMRWCWKWAGRAPDAVNIIDRDIPRIIQYWARSQVRYLGDTRFPLPSEKPRMRPAFRLLCSEPRSYLPTVHCCKSSVSTASCCSAEDHYGWHGRPRATADLLVMTSMCRP